MISLQDFPWPCVQLQPNVPLEVDPRWTILDKLNLNIGSNLSHMVMINVNEFVFATQSGGLYKYNIHQNKWTQFIKYPDNFSCLGHNIAFNDQQQKIYLYDSARTKMVTIDINTHHFEIISKCDISYIRHCMEPPCLLNANGIIHLIGGHVNTEHSQWNNINKSFNLIHAFSKFGIHTIERAQTIYIHSKKVILLIGGYGSIVTLMNNTKILKYSLISNQWSKLDNIEFFRYGHGAILTSDEKHIIITGGSFNNFCVGGTNDIFVLKIPENDDDEYILRKSRILCPMDGDNYCIRTGDKFRNKLLVSGYVKQLFATKEFKNVQVPHECIVHLITSWYGEELLHWIKYYKFTFKHFAIPIKYIIDNLE